MMGNQDRIDTFGLQVKKVGPINQTIPSILHKAMLQDHEQQCCSSREIDLDGIAKVRDDLLLAILCRRVAPAVRNEASCVSLVVFRVDFASVLLLLNECLLVPTVSVRFL
eukprot:scaffold664416_cov61-Prasinocladus_malaysianus.AAC.1